MPPLHSQLEEFQVRLTRHLPTPSGALFIVPTAYPFSDFQRAPFKHGGKGEEKRGGRASATKARELGPHRLILFSNHIYQPIADVAELDDGGVAENDVVYHPRTVALHGVVMEKVLARRFGYALS